MTALPPPSPDRGKSLPYNDISWPEFENLCSEILVTHRAGIEIDSELFGLPRKPQYGIDILGRLPDGTCDVVSCKRYKTIAKGKITTWSNDFADHWNSYWNNRGIKRFILAISTNIKNPDRLKEIEIQTERFAKLGIEFVVWHEKKLDRLLRSQSILVNQYFGEEYARRFCGVGQGSAKLDLQSEPRLLAFKRNIHADLDLAIEAFETGNSIQTDLILDRLFGDAEWTTLSERARDNCCRLKVARLLDDNRFDEIDELLELYSIQVGADQQALIILQRDGIKAALDFVKSTPEVPPSIKSQMHYGVGDFEAALAELTDLDDPLSLATQAKILAASGHYEEALQAQRSAETEQPRNSAILKSAVAVRLACSTCKAYKLGVFSTWPEPIQKELVRQDKEALMLLDEAADIARQYLSVTGLNEQDKKDWQVWLLALLISNPEKSDEANEFAKELIAKKKSHPGAVVWSLWHNLDIDLEKAKAALRKGLQHKNPSPDELFVLMMVLEAEGDIEGATNALENFSKRVRHYPGVEEAGASWRSRLKGETQDDPFPRLVQEAVSTKSWQVVAEHVRTELDTACDTAIPRLALTARLIAQSNDWENISGLLDDLETTIGTAEALEIAVYARINLRQPRQALELLSKTDAFPNCTLPLHLQSLKATSLELTGDTVGALKIRNELKGSNEDPHGLVLAQTLALTGDVDQFIETVKNVPLKNMQPAERLFAADVSRARQPEFAKNLLESVLEEEDLPDQLVGPTLQLAYPLGLEHRTKELIERATAGPVPILVQATMEDVIAHLRETEEQAERLNIMYREGVLPIGEFARNVNLSTAAIVYDFTDQGGAGILARHGSRMPNEPIKGDRNGYDQAGFRWSPDAKPKNLAIDLSALMLADKFEFLDELERTFTPLHVPPSLPVALTAEIQSSQHHQPSQVSNAKEVLEAIDDNRINILEDKAEWPGVVIDGSEINEAGSTPLSRFKSEFGSQNQNDAEPASNESAPLSAQPELPLLSSKVLLDLGTAEICAGEGMLSWLTERYSIWIKERDAGHIRRVCKREKRRQGAFERLTALHRRVVDGQRSGKYQTVSLEDISLTDGKRDDLDYRLLRELVSIKVDDGFLFSGDRFLTAFAKTTAIRVTDIATVLRWLESDGKLTGTKAREIRRAMRDAHVHFLPYEHGDLIHGLNNCPMEDGAVDENAFLRSFRCHLAEALAYQPWLRLDGSTGRDGQGLELAFAKDAAFSPIQSIRLIWEDRSLNNEQRIAFSDYVLDFMITLSLPRLPVNGSNEEKSQFAASLCGNLLSSAFLLSFQPDDRVDTYLGWLRSRFDYERTWIVDPFLKQATLWIKSVLEVCGSDLIGKDLKKASQLDRLTAGLLSEAFMKLPEKFTDALIDHEIIAAIGIRRSTTVEIGNLQLQKDAFTNALARCFDEKDIKLEADLDGNTIAVGLTLEPERSHRLKFTTSDHAYLISSAGLALTAASISPDPSSNYSKIDWIKNSVVQEFVESNMEDIENKLKAGEDVAQQIYCARLLRLTEAFAREENIEKSLMDLPSPEALLREFACKDRSADLEAALDRLVDEAVNEDLVKDLVLQLCSVPRDFPASLLSKLNSFSASKKRDLVATLEKQSKSTVRRSMVRRLSIQLDVAPPPDSDLMHVEDCSGYLAIFKWLWRQSERQEEWRSLSPDWRLFLIWYHSGEIAELFSTYNQPLSHVSDVIAPWDNRRLTEVFLPESGYGRDVSGPTISDVSFFLALVVTGWNDPTEDELSEIKQAITTTSGEAVFPEFETFEAHYLPDAMGSLMSACRISPPDWLVELSEGFDVKEVEKLSIKILSQAIEDDPAAMSWNFYWNLRRRGAPKDERNRVMEFWRSFELKKHVATNADWLLAFRGFLIFSNGYRDQEINAYFAGIILQLHEVVQNSDESLVWWSELIASFLVGSQGDTDADDLIEKLDLVFPAMAKEPAIWIKTLNRLAREMDIVDSAGVWERLTQLRALNSR